MAITYTSSEIQINSGKDSGTATAAGANTLTCSSKDWTVNAFVESYVWITAGTGAGQSDQIVINTRTALTVRNNWVTQPDNTSVFIISYKLSDIVTALPTYANWNTTVTTKTLTALASIRVLSGGFLGISREVVLFSNDNQYILSNTGSYLQAGYRINNTFNENGTYGAEIIGKQTSTLYVYLQLSGKSRFYATNFTFTRGVADDNKYVQINSGIIPESLELYDCSVKNIGWYFSGNDKVVGTKFISGPNNTAPDATVGLLGSPITFKNNLSNISPRADNWSQSINGGDIIDLLALSPTTYDMFLHNFNISSGGIVYVWNYISKNPWTNIGRWWTNSSTGRIYRGYLVSISVKDTSNNAISGATVSVLNNSGTAGILTGKESSASGGLTNKFPILSSTITTDANGTYAGVVGSGEGMPILYALYTKNGSPTATSDVSTETLYANFTFKVRKYGKKFFSSARSWNARSSESIFLDTNNYVVANEATAGAYTGITINGSAKTITISSTHTIQEIYDYSQWWATQSANITYDEAITTSDGATFTLATGWVLSGNSNITYGDDRFSGGTLVLDTAGTISPKLGAITLRFSATGTYDLSGGNFIGNLTLINTSAGNVEVIVPVGTSYTNSGPNITVRNPYLYQSVTVNGAVAGSRIQIYDTTNSVQLYEGTPTFPYTWTDSNPYSADRDIRVRVMHKDGATAKIWWEQNIGTSTEAIPALSVLVTQLDDEVYNTNAIDGSTVTGVTIVDSTLRVNVATGAITWQELYAYETDWLFTSDGIIDEGRFAEAKDTANYRWYNFKLKNTTSPTEPLVVSGGYGVDATTLASIDMIDDTGGTIILAPDHVVAKIVTVGGLNIITGDIAEIQADLTVINNGVKKASILVPHSQDL